MKKTIQSGIDWLISDVSSAMPNDLKAVNRWKVLKAFQDGKEHTAMEVSVETGISRQTIMKAIRFFSDNGLLESGGKGDSTCIGGKKPEFFVFTYEKIVLCISIKRERVYLSLFDMVKRDLGSTFFDIQTDETLDDIVHKIGEGAGTLLSEKGYGNNSLFGVGISTAAIVDYGNGNLYENRFNKAWPSNYPMAQRMREIFGNDAIIYVENAGKAAGRALLLHGSDSRDYRILTVFFDEGISSCMIEYGHVLNGSFSLIGEIGRIRSDQMLLEQLISDEYVRQRCQNAKVDSELCRLMRKVGLQDAFQCSRNGDKLAIDIVEEIAEEVGKFLYNSMFYFCPDYICFQGTFAKASDCFKKKLGQAIEREAEESIGKKIRHIYYDKRPIWKLEAWGLYSALSNSFFRSNKLYADGDNDFSRQSEMKMDS